MLVSHMNIWIVECCEHIKLPTWHLYTKQFSVLSPRGVISSDREMKDASS